MGLSFSPTAQARPSGYSTATCNGYAGGTKICTMNGPTQWRCDLRRNGETQAGTITVVYAGPEDSLCDYEDYCAFGTDGDNNLFYCDVTDSNIEQVWVVGTDYKSLGAGDDIQLNYDTATQHWDLNTHTAGTSVKGVVVAGEGGDGIEGSFATTTDYQDDLHGDSEDDTINGSGGDDLVWGNGSSDGEDGGPDSDTCDGNGSPVNSCETVSAGMLRPTHCP